MCNIYTVPVKSYLYIYIKIRPCSIIAHNDPIHVNKAKGTHLYPPVGSHRGLCDPFVPQWGPLGACAISIPIDPEWIRVCTGRGPEHFCARSRQSGFWSFLLNTHKAFVCVCVCVFVCESVCVCVSQ